MSEPLISVIMGCYNDEKYIRESIDSILNQTVSDFEFIIIDDGSTDSTVDIIQSYDDGRIVLIQNETNRGLGYNLHEGIKMARGKYLARMDADDISLPERFKKQIAFLEHNPDVLCIGTSFEKIGSLGLRSRLFSKYVHQPSDYQMIKVMLMLGTPIMHPSVMFNGALVRQNSINYDLTYKKAQDYELWSRIVWDYKIGNIDEIIFKYRYSNQQASNKNRLEQINNSKLIYSRVLKVVLGRDATDEEVELHTLFATQPRLNEKQLRKVSMFEKMLMEVNKKTGILSPQLLEQYYSKRWAVICSCSTSLLKRKKLFYTLPLCRKHYFNNFFRLYSRV